MAIAVGGVEERSLSDINVVPLTDVMLVLLIVFLITVPITLQTVEKLRIPVFKAAESKDKVENLMISVSTTDDAGRSPGEHGFQGASRNGQCRVYFDNVTPVDSTELGNLAFKRLDTIVKRAGGVDAIKADPEKIPQVILRADVKAPWRCVGGTVYDLQAAGYPTVGFISNPKPVSSR
jgi:biopolymer transport protein ExbD